MLTESRATVHNNDKDEKIASEVTVVQKDERDVEHNLDVKTTKDVIKIEVIPTIQNTKWNYITIGQGDLLPHTCQQML